MGRGCSSVLHYSSPSFALPVQDLCKLYKVGEPGGFIIVDEGVLDCVAEARAEDVELDGIVPL